jgi:hypothetical protein
MTLLPKVKLKTLVSFPAAVFGGTGLAVRKENGNFYFDLAFGELAQVSAVPTAALPTTFFALWESTTDTYRRMSVPDMQTQIGGGGGGGGIPEAPLDGFLYGRQGSGAVGAWAKGVKLAGDTMTGALVLNADPAVALGAATKQYVDAHSGGSTLVPGHLPGEPAGGNAAAGEVGEYFVCKMNNQSNTVAISIASPAVITEAGHGRSALSSVMFTTTGSLPTGITAGTTYYVMGGASLTTNTYQIATTIANAVAGTAVNTSGSQSGTHTSNYPSIATGVAKDIMALLLPAGDYRVQGTTQFVAGSGASMTFLGEWLSTVSATFNSDLNSGYASYNGNAQVNYSSGIPTSLTRFSLAAQGIVYLSALLNFTAAGFAVYGGMHAWRSR